MSANLVQRLIEAGVHFGHRASRWNPKMRPYIYGRQNLIHIIDVRETVRGLLRARNSSRTLRLRAERSCLSAPSGRRPKPRSERRPVVVCRSSPSAGWVVR